MKRVTFAVLLAICSVCVIAADTAHVWITQSSAQSRSMMSGQRKPIMVVVDYTAEATDAASIAAGLAAINDERAHVIVVRDAASHFTDEVGCAQAIKRVCNAVGSSARIMVYKSVEMSCTGSCHSDAAVEVVQVVIP